MTSESWAALQRLYPWPADPPDVPDDPQGFFDAENQRSLSRAFSLVPHTAPLVLELGTWKGKSARWMLETYPGARVICVDLWTPDVTYKDFGSKWAWLAQEPHLYETAQRNLWPFRDRSALVKARTVDGIAHVAACGAVPDVVYIDAGHTYEDVKADLAGTLQHWPAARPDRTDQGTVILGDDFNQEPVRRAVEELAPGARCVVADERSVWRLVPKVTKWGDYEHEYGLLDVRDQVVLDLGAERGSTAQYFLAEGASKVLVSERDPKHVARLHAQADTDSRIVVLRPLLKPVLYERWMAAHQPSRVKCDIEGGEEHLLTCSRVAFRTPEAYTIETHSPALHAALVARLAECGYRVTITRRFASNPNVQVLYATRRRIPEYEGLRAREYDARRQNQAEWRAEHEAVERWLKDAPAGSTVLDVPVGTGRFLPLYAERGLRAIGIDRSQAMLEQARQKGTAVLQIGDVLDLPRMMADRSVCIRLANWLTPSELARAIGQLTKVTSRSILLGLITSVKGGENVGGARAHADRDVARRISSCGWRCRERLPIAGGASYRYDLWSLERLDAQG